MVYLLVCLDEVGMLLFYALLQRREPKDFVYLRSSSLDACPILHAYGKHIDSAKSLKERDRER